jgi:hypothetical protein
LIVLQLRKTAAIDVRFSAERISCLQEPVNELFWRDKWMISMTRDGISVEIEGRNAHRDRSLARSTG